MNIAYNQDCMEALREMPDKAFDLAVVDPPYGGGFTEGGGCKGWFTKYNEKCSQSVNVEREREREREREADARLDRYHISNEDRRDLGGEVQPARGCL